MTNHIPPDKLLPQDMVVVYDHGPKDKPFETPVAHKMHAVDAKHSMGVEPERWALDPRPKPEPEPEPVITEETFEAEDGE